MLNIPTLSTLVQWAAEEEMRDTDPAKAVESGISRERDPRLGRHYQGAWGKATRNGVCKTAFCIAGGAAQLSNEWVIVMHEVSNGNWDTDYVINRKKIPQRLESSIQWDLLWVEEEEYDRLMVGGLLVHIDGKAEKLLGLTSEQADALFDGENDAAAVVSLTTQFAAEEGVTLNLPAWVIEEFQDPGNEELAEYLDKTNQLRRARV